MIWSEIFFEEGNFSSLDSRNVSWSFYSSFEKENAYGGKIQNEKELVYGVSKIFAAFWTFLAYGLRIGKKIPMGACWKGKKNDDQRKRREGNR